MRYLFNEDSWEEYLFWQRTDRKMLNKINALLKAISRDPYKGQGKPEPLKYNYKGCWSRRINNEHRLIYQVREEGILIVKCRFQYD